MLKKYGEAIDFSSVDYSITTKDILANSATGHFTKLAEKIKQLMPNPDEFLIGHAVMMHAAEASLVDQETGEPVKDRFGKVVEGGFVKTTDGKGKESVRWETTADVKPYKNNNGDIFPEEDLIKAHKEWVGKPLCKDHVSDSIDGVRGIIIDTYYEPKFKRVHALFALDRKNYADLARKVEAGYATSVSMGTAVGRSICTECANVATVESEYCHHVRSRTCYGEVNKDLNPIELSIVVTGADPKAKILTVLAQLDAYKKKINAVKTGSASIYTLSGLDNKLDRIAEDIELQKLAKPTLNNIAKSALTNKLVQIISIIRDNSDTSLKEKVVDIINSTLKEEGVTLSDLSHYNKIQVLQAAASKKLDLGSDVIISALNEWAPKSNKDESSVLPGSVSREGIPTNEMVDSYGYSTNFPEPGVGTPGDFGAYASSDQEKEGNQSLANKIAEMKEQIAILEKKYKENDMSISQLNKRRLNRVAYWQGTEEPKPGQEQYAPMGDAVKIRDNEDKQMTQTGDLGGADGLVPGDLEKKKMVQRAELLEERRNRREGWLREAQKGTVVEMRDGSKALVDENTGERFAKDNKAKGKKKEEKADAKKTKKKAYWQGTEEPKPGEQQYAPMGDAVKIRDNDDKQMTQTGDLGGADGLVPGDLEKKKMVQRASKISGKLYRNANDISKSRWVFASDGKPVLTVTASDAYGKFLNDKFTKDSTYADLFHSKEWGEKVRSMLKTDGLSKTAQKLRIKKVAQDPLAPVAPAAPMPGAGQPAPAAPMPGAGQPAPAMDMDMGLGEVEDIAAESDKAEELRSRVEPLIQSLEDAVEELRSEVQGADQGVESLDVPSGEDSLVTDDLAGMEPMGDMMAGAEMPRMASVKTSDVLEVYAALNNSLNELCFIEHEIGSKKASDSFVTLAKQAVADAKECLGVARATTEQYKEAKLKAFKLARQARRNKLLKAAECMADDEDHVHDDSCAGDKADDGAAVGHDYALDENDMRVINQMIEDGAANEVDEHEIELHDDEVKEEEGDVDSLWKDEVEMGDTLPEMGDLDDLPDYAMMTSAQRKVWRESLLKQAAAYDDLYTAERKGGGAKLKGLDAASDSGMAKVHALHEVHDKMEDVATKPIGKVREAARKLDVWIKESGLNPAKLDSLVAKGAVDADAASYWKEFYAEGDSEASSFGKEMAKEFQATKQASVSESREARIRRAYAVGTEAQQKGLIGINRTALEQYFDTLVELEDKQFEHMIRHVAQYKPVVKTAMPIVGQRNVEDEQPLILEKRASVSVRDLQSLFTN